MDLVLSEPGKGSTYIVYGQWIWYCQSLVRVLLTLSMDSGSLVRVLLTLSMDSGFGTVRAWLGFYLHCLWTEDLVLSEPG